MYGLFYVGYVLFGGITGILSCIKIIDAFRQREEAHQAHVNIATAEAFRLGYEESLRQTNEENYGVPWSLCLGPQLPHEVRLQYGALEDS